MTAPNDWKKLNEELEEVKRAEYHRGYEKAVEDFGSAKVKIADDRALLDRKINTWNHAISKVREAWAKHTGQPAQWKDPSKDKYRYQVLFGNKQLVKDSVYLNMPEDMEQFVYALEECVKMANDFQTLLDAFQKNPVVKAQWDRLLVAMRMTE